MQFPPKLQYNSLQILKGHTSASYGKNQKLKIPKRIPNNTIIAGGIMILELKLYYRAMVIKPAWYWH